MTTRSYWMETATPFAGGREGPLPARADVVVVGGGFTGLSAARTLARGGADVVLIEAGRVAGEASGRNGGQCNNGLAGDLGGLAARFGMERAVALYRAFDAGVDLVEAIVREDAIDCDFVRNGKLKLADKPEHAGKLAATAALLAREVEPDIRLLDRAQLGAEIVSDQFHGSLLFPRSAQMHMGRFGAGLAAAAAQHGAALYENTPLVGLSRLSGTRHRLRTPRGEIEAGRVLLATGASMQGPFGWFRRRIVPIGSFVIATAPMAPDRLAALMPGARNCTTTRNVGNYFRTTPDGRLIFGGRARFALSSPKSDAKSGAILKQDIVRIFPSLAGVPIDHVWGGIVDMSADRLPRAGERDGVLYAMGYSGHGTQMSVLMGDRMAAVILGRDADNPLAGIDWPAIPGHFGPPWFLPLVGAWYRYQDWRH